MDFKTLADVIKDSKRIGVTFHTSPDGDAIGSTLALVNGLRHLGKKAYVISREVILNNLSFLPSADEIDGTTTKPDFETDLVIVLDCGNVDRICADLDDYNGVKINLDHHISNENYGDYNYVDAKAAATCELVYLLLKELEFDFSKDNKSVVEVGSCIYTGLVTDTGSFRHANVTKRTHFIAGDLIDCGVNNTKIHNMLFDNKPFNKVQLMGNALSSISLYCDNKVSYIEIPLKVLDMYNLENVDTSDVISIALSIAGVEVAVVVKEIENGIKASLRSKDKCDVRNIAEKLGGGGHIKAAGLKIESVSLEEAKNKILSEIEKEL